MRKLKKPEEKGVDNRIHKISSYVDKLNNDEDNDGVGGDINGDNGQTVNSNRKPRGQNIVYSKYLFGKSYENFLGKIDNVVTKGVYRYNLYCICERLNLTTEQLYEKYSDELSSERKDCKLLENQLRDIILQFKKTLEKEYDPHSNSIHMNIIAFQNFCEANRINLNIKWVNGFLPKKPVKGKDKKYTREQILLMLNKGAIDLRSKLITLLFSTNGIREGALCRLEDQDIRPRYAEDASGRLEGASICVYRGDPAEDVIFTTPECYHVYDLYKQAREELGDKIVPESPVIIGRIPAKMNSKKKSILKRVTESTISAICVNVAVRAGVRKLLKDYDHRYVSKVTHGFRKYFETTILHAKNKNDKSNKIDPYTADRLLSHSRRGGLRLLKHYDDAEINQYFEYYKRVIPDLTFSKEEEYRVKYEQAEVKLESTKQTHDYIKQKEIEMNELNQRLSKMEQENKEAISRLLSLIAKESIVGKPVLPKSQLDLLLNGKLDAIPFPVSNRDGEDVKLFTIDKNLESIRHNSKKFRKLAKPTPSRKNKLYMLEDPPAEFMIKKKRSG